MDFWVDNGAVSRARVESHGQNLLHMISHSSPDFSEAEAAALTECLRSGQVKGGPRVEALERRIAADMGYTGGVATSTGSHAIELALRAAFVGAVGRVGMPTYVCRSVYDAIVATGGEPALVDADGEHFSISTKAGPQCAAWVVPHMFGVRAPVEALAARGGLLIEDCAM